MTTNSVFNWTYLESLPLRPKMAFFQNNNIKDIIDQFPTGPQPEVDPTIVDCLSSPLSITVASNKYLFGSSTNVYGVTQGVYRFSVPEEHPIAFLNFGKKDSIYYTGSGTIDKRALPAIDGNYGYQFVYGDVYLTVTEDFGTLSYCCLYHGYEGGRNNLRYKSSCQATPEPVVKCLGKINTLDIVDGVLTINGEEGPFGLNTGYYELAFNFTTEQGATHALRVIKDENDTSVSLDGNGVQVINGYPGFFEGIGLAVFDQFGKFTLQCLVHPEEIFPECLVFSHTCEPPLPDTYEPVIYVQPTVIEAYLIMYDSMNEIYTVCDKDGNYLAVDSNSGFPSLQVYPDIPITYPFQSTDNQTGIIYNIVGLYNIFQEGDFKIMDSPAGILPEGYYVLTDIDGVPVKSTNPTYLDYYIGIPWNGSATFPFNATGIYALGSSSNLVTTNTTYTIIGIQVLVVPNCRIAMAKIGAYETPNTYMVLDSDGNQINDQFLVSAQNVSDVTARIIWDPESDTLPSIKSHASLQSTAKYSITAYYTFMDPVKYSAKQGKLNEYETSTIYTLVDSFGNPKYDPGTNNTTLVKVTLPDDQAFPVIKFPSSPYNVIQYQIQTRTIEFQPGEYMIQQQVTNDAPELLLYSLVDLSGNKVDDPGTNNTTKVIVSRRPNRGFPEFYRSVNWFVNAYKVIGVYSQTAGDYTMRYTGSGTLYSLLNGDGNVVPDVGTNSTTNVSIDYTGSVTNLPQFVFSDSGYTGIRYRVTKIEIPRPITLDVSGPTGPSQGSSTGPAVTNIQYYFGSIFESFPDFQSATGPYTGPLTESITETSTGASGPLESAAPPAASSIAGGTSLYYISADNIVTSP
jgi:hypothetical protein